MLKKSCNLILVFLLPLVVFAQNEPEVIEATETPSVDPTPTDIVNTIQSQLGEHKQAIDSLEQEIEIYAKQLEETQTEKNTLKTEVDTLNISAQRLQADISLTQRRINVSDLELSNISKDIIVKTEEVDILLKAIGRLYRDANEVENVDLFYTLLSSSSKSIFDAVRRASEITELKKELKNTILEHEKLTVNLSVNKKEVSATRNRLSGLRTQYSAKKSILDSTLNVREKILKETEAEEEKYQALLAEKRIARAEITTELLNFESQLNFILNPDSIPAPKKGVLGHPLKNIRLTQGFGHTSFALRNRGTYINNFHAGLDFAASIGTEILASQGGRVVGQGDTDLRSSCVSWGKWIMIEHDNGLSTLYAHLSHIGVEYNDVVKRGDIIGYSGNTGFSTGPHLHFGVYASKGSKIVPYEEISSSGRCAGLLVPVAADNAKLDPRDYLKL